MRLTRKTNSSQVRHWGDSSLLPNRRWKRLCLFGEVQGVCDERGVCRDILMGIFHGLGWGSLTQVVCTVARLQDRARRFLRKLVASGLSLGEHELTACGHTHCECTHQKQQQPCCLFLRSQLVEHMWRAPLAEPSEDAMGGHDGGGGTGSARRRRERRLRQHWRHEQLTLRMVLAATQHHSAPRGQRMAGTRGGARRTTRPRSRQAPPPGGWRAVLQHGRRGDCVSRRAACTVGGGAAAGRAWAAWRHRL